MPVGPVSGSSSNQPFGSGGPSGGGFGFRLGSIKEQFTRLNAKFDQLKSGGHHDEAVRAKEHQDFVNLHKDLSEIVKKDPEILDEAQKKSLEKMKQFIEEEEKKEIK